MRTVFFVSRTQNKSASCKSVNMENNAGDISRFIGSKEGKGLGYILGLTQTAERNLGYKGLNNLLGNCLHHIGFGDAGGNSVHADALGAQLAGKGEGEAVYSELGCGIGKAGGLSVFAYHGGGG